MRCVARMRRACKCPFYTGVRVHLRFPRPPRVRIICRLERAVLSSKHEVPATRDLSRARSEDIASRALARHAHAIEVAELALADGIW